jgi:hypothetical protein
MVEFSVHGNGSLGFIKREDFFISKENMYFSRITYDPWA